MRRIRGKRTNFFSVAPSVSTTTQPPKNGKREEGIGGQWGGEGGVAVLGQFVTPPPPLFTDRKSPTFDTNLFEEKIIDKLYCGRL